MSNERVAEVNAHTPIPRTIADSEKVILRAFYAAVCVRAEANMAATGTVSGAHWNAMRQVLKEMGIEVWS